MKRLGLVVVVAAAVLGAWLALPRVSFDWLRDAYNLASSYRSNDRPRHQATPES